jgi:putative flavoprotein involved in K+ transport
VDAVLWATGYHDDGKWVTIPETKDASGGFVHQRGVSPTPDLYLMGRSWQWTRGSALLAGVGDDAAYVASRIAERLPGKTKGVPNLADHSSATAVAAASLSEDNRT